MNLKKYVAMTLMAGIILGVPSTFANNETPASSFAAVQSVKSMGSNVIVPYSTTQVIMNDSISNTKYQNNYTINPGSGYVKVSIKNTGPNPITFTVNQGSPAGAEKMYYVVPADGKPYNYFTEETPWSTGVFYITISSGQYMSGTVGVRLGTNLVELKNT
ncbi:hypothetical protein [Paenibacillus chibensis]|uniref:hypothetical protein n=1 Tax=Paenibacillus chibensis TaxID=59846 RepID=UPI000FDC84CD|nr:hypothetical protein [Paenibacillus chibensis]MEC0372118.1 hypothetical protein [Paenibacillus chibensis]